MTIIGGGVEQTTSPSTRRDVSSIMRRSLGGAEVLRLCRFHKEARHGGCAQPHLFYARRSVTVVSDAASPPCLSSRKACLSGFTYAGVPVKVEGAISPV